MTDDAKKMLTPKLRFPEFRHVSGWNLLPLKSACQMQAGKFVQAADISEKQQDGLFPCYGGNGLRGYTKTFTHSGKYPLIGRQGALCGNVKLAGGYFHATEHAVVASARSGINVDWLFHTLELSNLNQYATGQAQPGVSVEVLEKVPIAIPPEESEQQKIAECLSTLDERIGAESQKLDALKAHKKGLMQQLFPREGETLPRLRFPEFQDAPEWEARPIGDEVDLLSGFPFDGPDITQDSDGIRLLRGINVTEGRVRHSEEIDRYYLKPVDSLERFRVRVNDLVIAMDGSKVGKNSALISKADEGALLVQRVARLRSESPTTIAFIFHQINSSVFHEYVDRINTSSGIPHISAKQIREFTIRFPSEAEQDQVASCLSSLDDLIAAQSDQLEALKTHKKGLMQQLFPAPAEAVT